MNKTIRESSITIIEDRDTTQINTSLNITTFQDYRVIKPFNTKGSEADIYLIDEPSAYLDAKQRMKVAKVIRKIMEKENKAALVVEHDVYFIDMVSQSLMVFLGIPGKHGIGKGPLA